VAFNDLIGVFVSGDLCNGCSVPCVVVVTNSLLRAKCRPTIFLSMQAVGNS